MVRLIPTFAFAIVLVVAAGSVAQDGKDKKAGPTGVWTREAGGIDLKFDFTGGKSPFKASVFKGDDGFTATCKYEIKDGVVKAHITAVEDKGNFPNPPPIGSEFSFKWTPKDNTAELSDLMGDNTEGVKPLVEGEYTRVKGKDKK
jgi:hypothetical protein